MDNCAEKRWIVDIDIIVNEDALFHFSLSDDIVPSDKLDFSSTMFHELGHAHSHHHATLPWTGNQMDQTKTMYFSLLNGWKKRYIDSECAIPGSEFMLKSSMDLQVRPPMTEGSCIINSLGSTYGIGTDFKVFPNPFYSNFEIQLLGEKTYHSAGLELYNLQGELIIETNFVTSNSNYEFRPPSHLPSGVYMLIIRLDSNIYSSKVIKI